jgi:hypothetical protein
MNKNKFLIIILFQYINICLGWWNNCPTPGWYCGDSVISNSNAYSIDKLLYCDGIGSVPKRLGPCINGCKTEPYGDDDYCINQIV